MNNKQTAVEWLVEQIIIKHPIITQYLPNYNFDKEIIEKAKEMEKKQIKNSYRSGTIDGFNFRKASITSMSPDSEKYYNKEFGANNEHE